MKNSKCVIVVPVYKDVPDELEQLSLKQLNMIIDNELDIVFIAPSTINNNEYIKLFDKSDVNLINFSDEYFKSNKTYSQLCLSYDFYKTFNKYEYMLLYQTDCWLFENDIIKWCDMGYDYIGAPIYSPGSRWPNFRTTMRPIVGNGGLSLRKISKMMNITDRTGYIYKKHESEWSTVEYEDMFICDVIAHDIYMRIPDYKIAEQFSIDALPLNIRQLKIPMSVHRVFAFYEWWKNSIPELIDEHILELCKNELERFKKMYN